MIKHHYYTHLIKHHHHYTDLSTIELQTKELERILLRYNNSIKLVFKKYADLSGKYIYICVYTRM
jgi:hypothetical protein